MKKILKKEEHKSKFYTIFKEVEYLIDDELLEKEPNTPEDEYTLIDFQEWKTLDQQCLIDFFLDLQFFHIEEYKYPKGYPEISGEQINALYHECLLQSHFIDLEKKRVDDKMSKDWNAVFKENWPLSKPRLKIQIKRDILEHLNISEYALKRYRSNKIINTDERAKIALKLCSYLFTKCYNVYYPDVEELRIHRPFPTDYKDEHILNKINFSFRKVDLKIHKPLYEQIEVRAREQQLTIDNYIKLLIMKDITGG